MGKFFVGFSSFNGIIGGGFGGQYDSIKKYPMIITGLLSSNQRNAGIDKWLTSF